MTAKHTWIYTDGDLIRMAEQLTCTEIARLEGLRDEGAVIAKLAALNVDHMAAYLNRHPLMKLGNAEIMRRLTVMSGRELASQLGVSYAALLCKLKRMGVSMRRLTRRHNPRCRLEAIPDNTLKAMLETLLVKEIMAVLKVSRSALKARFRRMGLPSQIKRGEKSPYWTGYSTAREVDSRSDAYRAWRSAVFRRDNYTCRECGTTRDIVADHIKSWRNYPSLRHDVKNGQTLCRTCHRKTPNYGGKVRLNAKL